MNLMGFEKRSDRLVATWKQTERRLRKSQRIKRKIDRKAQSERHGLKESEREKKRLRN